LIHSIKETLKSDLSLGNENFHWEKRPFTGKRDIQKRALKVIVYSKFRGEAPGRVVCDVVFE